MPQLELIKDVKKLGKAIKSIATRGAKLDSDIHIAAVSCLHHAFNHGDVTLMTKLVDAMPKSGRRKALIHWVQEHSLLGYVEGEQAFRMTASKTKQWKLKVAEETPFWEFTTEKAPTDLTMEQLVKLVVTKVQKAKDDDRLVEGFSIKGLETQLVSGLNAIDMGVVKH